jgi:uncharacterized protein (TIGR03435 family)
MPVLGQAPRDGRPLAFEVASVKRNTSLDDRARGVGLPPDGRFLMTALPVRSLIRFAFNIQNVQLVDAPNWVDSELYDVVAKAPREQVQANGQVPREALAAMVEGLLIDRFKLAARRDTREMPIYALVLANGNQRLGPQLRPSSVDCEALDRRGERPPAPQPGAPAPCGGELRVGHVALRGFNVKQLAANLSNWLDRPVVDRTGLKGGFDFTLDWSPDQQPQYDAVGAPIRRADVPVDRTGPSIFTAVEEQLGLKLDAVKGLVDVVVIDHVERPSPD